MKKIESFTIDHTKLLPGLYVSRRDAKENCDVTTFDIRVTKPNIEPAMDVPAMHTMEHLGATFLRNSNKSNEIIYFGPMGCRTGFYLVMFGKLNPQDVKELVVSTFDFIKNYEGDIPGASAVECGNYVDQNLTVAKFYADKYLKSLEEYKSYVYV